MNNTGSGSSSSTTMPPLVRLDSSSSDISSPPLSPPSHSTTLATRLPHSSSSGHPALPAGVVANPAHPQHHTAAIPFNANPARTADAPPKQKRPRKPKEPKNANAPADETTVKEKKPRKPREPKVKKEGDASTATSRKRQKTDEKSTPGPADVHSSSRQPTITEMVSHFQAPAPPTNAPRQPQYQPPLQPPPLQQSSHPAESVARSSLPPRATETPTPRPISSGQNYDPIRGSTRDAAPRPPFTASAPTNGVSSVQAAPASPSIPTLVDSASVPMPSAPPETSYVTHITAKQEQHPQPSPFNTTQHAPTPFAASQPPAPTTAFSSQANSASHPPPSMMDGAMDVDGPVCENAIKPPPELKVQSKASSSAAPTPKPAKTNSPPKGSGSGLLSGSHLLGGTSANQGAERKGIDIELRISLNPQGGNNINIAQEIARRYGRDAINPRAAAHRERLLQVAAAANRLDGGSADDMSVDLMSEAEGDSNVEMGGLDDEKSATGEEKPRKRRKKVEEYDKEDDFIDDTELVWQEQAAVAKDGFFVYSGPLIPEGPNAPAESTGTTRGRGGGRGRGRGRAAAAAAAAAANGTTHASLAEKKDGATTGRGRGRGRGTGAPRKPRITKADRERMEAEKQERMTASGAPQPTTTVPGSSNFPITLVATPSTGMGAQNAVYATAQGRGGVPV